MFSINKYPIARPYFEEIREKLYRSYRRELVERIPGYQEKDVIMKFFEEEIKYEDYTYNENALNINFGTSFVGKYNGRTSKVKEKINVNTRNKYDFGHRHVFIKSFKPTGHGKLIKDGSIKLAEYYPELNTLNFLFDFKSFEELYSIKNEFGRITLTDKGIKFIESVFKRVFNLLKNTIEAEFLVNRVMNVDFKTKKDIVSSSIKSFIEASSTQKIELANIRIRQLTEQIENAKRMITESVKNISISMGELELYKNMDNSYLEKLLNELQLISEYPLIKSVGFDNNELLLLTKYIPIKVDDKIYSGNEYAISIRLSDTRISIKSSIGVGYAGFWSPNDPHPHVAESGTQCLGNVSNTLAQLSAENELYALTVMIIEFLKTANTSDPAGRKVLRYPVISNEEFEVISNSYSGGDYNPFEFEREVEPMLCHHCEGSILEDDEYREAYDAHGNTVYLCMDCTGHIDGDDNYCEEEYEPEEDYDDDWSDEDED